MFDRECFFVFLDDVPGPVCRMRLYLGVHVLLDCLVEAGVDRRAHLHYILKFKSQNEEMFQNISEH